MHLRYCYNEQLGDAIIVTVIATGFEETKKVAKKRSDSRPKESLFTQPSVQAPTTAGVVTSVEENTGDDSIRTSSLIANVFPLYG